MAFKKKCVNEIIGAVLVLSALSTASAVDCHGKSFHCVNATHFMICVDLGGGVSQTIDNFLIPCPPPTVCQATNRFECEFPAPTTPLTTLNVISETTQPWEDVAVTTNSPQRKTTKEYSEKYVNTESLSLAESFTTDATVYTTEAPSISFIDLNNRNLTETISTPPESNVYETTTTEETLTESILNYDTTNLGPVPQIIPENITTGATEVTTEIPLVSTEGDVISDLATTTTQSIISANNSSLSINVNMTSLPEDAMSVNITSNMTSDNVHAHANTSNSLKTDTIIGLEQAVTVTLTTEETFTTEVNSLANNQFGFTAELVPNDPILEQTTLSYYTFDVKNTDPQTTINPEILTTDTTVNLATEGPTPSKEQMSLNQLHTTVNTIVAQDNATTKRVVADSPTSPVNNKDQTRTDDFYMNKIDQVQPISTGDKAHFTTENTVAVNEAGVVKYLNATLSSRQIDSIINKTQNGTNQNIENQEERKSTTETGFFEDNTETKHSKSVTAAIPMGDSKNLALKNETQKDLNQIIKNLEDINPTTESELIKNNSETNRPNSIISHLPTKENNTDKNILANTIFDSVIPPTVISIEETTPTISEVNFETGVSESTTETTLLSASIDQVTIDKAFGTAQSTTMNENDIVTENNNFIVEKNPQYPTTQLPQDQEVSTIENSYTATNQPNVNTFENSVTTENGFYLPMDTSIITNSEGFAGGIQSLQTTEQTITLSFDENLQTVAKNDAATEQSTISAANEEAPLQSNTEKVLEKEKPIFIISDNFATGVSNSSKVGDSNDIQGAITNIPQDQVASTIEMEYVSDGIVTVTVQPEIMVVTRESAIYDNILQNDPSTTIPNSLQTATVEVFQDKSIPPYDSVATITTSVDVFENIQDSNNTINMTDQSSNWKDTVTTDSPLEVGKLVSNIFDTNTIHRNQNQEQVKEKVFGIEVTTDTVVMPNLDSTTTEPNNLSLSTIDSGISSTNLEALQIIGSNTEAYETTSEKGTEIASDVTSGTTKVYNKISTIDNTDVQDIKSTSSGTTENINTVNERGMNQIGSVMIIDTNTISQNTQDPKKSSSIPNLPVTDTNIISQNNQNNNSMIDKLEINKAIDVVSTTVTLNNFSDKVNIVTEKAKLTGKMGLEEVVNDNFINQQDQTASESIDKGTLNGLNKTIEGTTNLIQIPSDSHVNSLIEQINPGSEHTFVDVSVTTNLHDDRTITTDTNIDQISSIGNDIFDSNIINQQSQTASQSIDKGIPNGLKAVDGSTNSDKIISDPQSNTMIDQFNHDSEQTSVTVILVTDSLYDIKTTTTESDKGQTRSSGLDTTVNNIINQQNQITSESYDTVTSNAINSINGSADFNQIIIDPPATTIFNQDTEKEKVGGILVNNAVNHVKTTTTENYKGQTDTVAHSQLGVNENKQTTSGSIGIVTSNSLKNIEGTTNANHIVSDSDGNEIINEFSQGSEQAASIIVTDDKTATTELNKGQTSSTLNSGFDESNNNIINQQSPTTLEGSTKSIQPAINHQFNQEFQQTSVAGVLVTDALNDVKMTTEGNTRQTNIQVNPHSTDDKTFNVIPVNEKMPSNGLDNSGLASKPVDDVHPFDITTQTTEIVNNLNDNQDGSSSAPLTNIKAKSSVLENVLQTIGNFFNTSSKNSSLTNGNTNNQVQTENNIEVLKEMTEANNANIGITTERNSLLDSKLFNNVQVSKVGETIAKPDVNVKVAPVEKDQSIISNLKIDKPVAHIVPFNEASDPTNKVEDLVTTNVEVSKTISETSTEASASKSQNNPSTVFESATLDILTTKTTKIGSSGTLKDKEDLLSLYKVNNMEITTESYIPVTYNTATIISHTTGIPKKQLQKSDKLPVVPLTEDIPFVDSTKLSEHIISPISEQIFTNGDRSDIGTVLANTNLNAKANVNSGMAVENNAQHGRNSIQGTGSSASNVINILQSTEITSFTNSEDKKMQKDSNTTVPRLIFGSAQDKKPSTYESKNSGNRKPPNEISENINENTVSANINQQSDLSAQQSTINTIVKEITQSPIPINATISTDTKYLRNNSAVVVNNTSQPANNNIDTNVQKNTGVNITGPINKQVTVTKKPAPKIISSVSSTTQASARKTLPKSASNVTENPKKQVVNNTLNYSCISGIRGRYSDKDDCRKFYICVGNTEPIVGQCPVNTVFSDIKKLCTKNMSHCIRENEFKCPSDGRYSDFTKENVYYICVSHKSHLYRFKFQCQKGFTLNKNTVRCIENKEIESNESVSISSSDNDSDSSGSQITSNSSTSSSGNSISSSSSTGSSSSSSSGDSESNSTNNKEEKEKPESKDGDDDGDEVFECEKVGKFPVKNDCKRYYLCKKNGKGQYRRKLKKCESGDIFHKKKRKCVDADDYEC